MQLSDKGSDGVTNHDDFYYRLPKKMESRIADAVYFPSAGYIVFVIKNYTKGPDNDYIINRRINYAITERHYIINYDANIRVNP
jgi:hypothetical protein